MGVGASRMEMEGLCGGEWGPYHSDCDVRLPTKNFAIFPDSAYAILFMWLRAAPRIALPIG